jgi:ribokinase
MMIHVVGNCTVDVVFRVDHFPEPGETVLAQERFVDLGGKGANQAVVAARFGAPVRLVAPVGRDADGAWALARLCDEGLPSDALIQTAAPTDQSIITVVPSGENMIVSSAAAARSMTPDMARSAMAGVRPGDLVMVQGNLSQETTHAALRCARDAGAKTMVNPAPIQWSYEEIWPLCRIAVLNKVECRKLLGTNDLKVALVRLRLFGVDLPVVTLGSEGAAALDRDELTRLPAVPVEVVDTTGAGDAFCGALAAALSRGARAAAALDLAMRAAAITVTRRGTQSAFPTRAEAAALWAETAGVET